MFHWLFGHADQSLWSRFSQMNEVHSLVQYWHQGFSRISANWSLSFVSVTEFYFCHICFKLFYFVRIKWYHMRVRMKTVNAWWDKLLEIRLWGIALLPLTFLYYKVFHRIFLISFFAAFVKRVNNTYEDVISFVKVTLLYKHPRTSYSIVTKKTSAARA